MNYSPSLRKLRMAQAVQEIREPAEPSSASLPNASDGTHASEIRPSCLDSVSIPNPFDRSITIDELEMRLLNEGPPIPAHWSKGALLNVRNRGDYYVITLYPEEEDPRHPERAMRFANTWTCQDFVSKWYSRETADPRAR